MTRMTRPESRFFRRVRLDGECWSWAGTKNRGYGHFRVDGARVYAHRWAYEFFVAPIPEGLTIDHLCRNRACVNPEHLEPVPLRVNIHRSNAASVPFIGVTHCIHGHEFTEANTIRVPEGRRCRACKNRRTAEYKARKRVVA